MKKHQNQLIFNSDTTLPKSDHQFDYFYLDLQAYNIASETALPQPLTFTNQRDGPFLSGKASDYELSIVRFSLDTNTLPIFVPTIIPGSNDPDQTIYSFTLSVTIGGTLYEEQTYMEWIPQNLSIPVPSAPAFNNPQIQSNETGYYNCLNYTWVPLLLQNTFNTCFNDLNAQVVAGGGVLPTIYAPVIIYDTASTLMTIYCDEQGYDPTVNTTDCISIYMNAPMYGLLESFLTQYLGVNQPLGKNYQLVVNSFNGTNITLLPTTSATSVPSVAINQAYSSIGIWNPVESIVFTSNTLPVNVTSLLPPIVLFNGINIGPQTSNSNVGNILTTFQSPNQVYRPNIAYQPSVYRFISLSGNSPLRLFQVNVYWRDYLGNLNEFKLGSTQGFSMLTMFKKRNAF